jgi:hypothetical protein
VPTYEAQTALPYPHRDRATGGLRAQLRYLLPAAVTANWTTFSVTGPIETTDFRGHTWYEYRAELTTDED